MAVTGRLEETGVPGILQVFAQGKKTGRLTFSCSDSQAVVVLHEGQLVYAASNSVRETLGHCLISRGTIDGETLAEALTRQHASKNSVRLGNVLQEMGAVSEEEVLDIVTAQARRVLREIVGWTVGFFKFEKMEFHDGGEIPVDLNDFLMEEGLRVDRVLLDIAMDEEEEDDAEDVPALTLSLREVIGQVSHPTINAEVTQALLSFSSAFLDRAVLLLHDSGGFEGIAHFGVPPETSEAVRDIRVPASDHLFAAVVESRQCATGPMTPEALGKLAPVFDLDETREVVICPLVVNDEVLLLLVGEAGGRTIGSADLLEAVMLQTGLVMEKALLQQRVAALEKQLEELKESQAEAPAPAAESRVSLSSGGLAQPSGTGIAESSQRIADLLAGRTQG